jgi:hypothetical protein
VTASPGLVSRNRHSQSGEMLDVVWFHLVGPIRVRGKHTAAAPQRATLLEAQSGRWSFSVTPFMIFHFPSRPANNWLARFARRCFFGPPVGSHRAVGEPHRQAWALLHPRQHLSNTLIRN